MNKYEKAQLISDVKRSSKADVEYITLCHNDIVSRRDKMKQYDRLAEAGYTKDMFGNFFRNTHKTTNKH